MLCRLPACARDLPDSVVRALAAPAPRARGGGRPAAGRRRRGGGGTPLGGGGAGAGPGCSPPRRRRGAAETGPNRGRRASPVGQGIRERDTAAKWRPRARSCALRNGGSAECPDGVAWGACARGWGQAGAPPRFPFGVVRGRHNPGATPNAPSLGPSYVLQGAFWPVFRSHSA